MKKKVALMTAIAMTLTSGVASAQGTLPSKSKIKAAGGTKPTGLNLKKQTKEEENYSKNDTVRVVVELEQKPAIQYAQEKNMRYSALSASEKSSLKEKITKEQDTIKEDIEKKDIAVKYKENFTTVINGFSGEMKYGDIKDIKKLEGVKDVHISHEYKRPETFKGAKPEMIYSKDLINAKETWKDYGYKGQGEVVAVIDTGIDSTHRDMKLSEGTKVKLTSGKVDSLKQSKKLKGKYYTEKVPYGYNYADHDSEIRDLGPGASMHGMHVAGTVGANGDEDNGGIKGVAPEAQLLAMKVFGNDPGMPSTFSDIYVKAIDDAIALGADVINMSLGSTAAFVRPDEPEQKAIVNAVNNGILCAISAGNSAHAGNGAGSPLPSNPDTGVVGSPGLADKSLQVASYENSKLSLDGMGLMIDGKDTGTIAYQKQSSPNPIEVFNKEKKEVIYVGDGSPDGYKGKSVKDKVVFAVRNGSFNYTMIQKEAEKQGAAGLIVRGKVEHGDYVNMALDNPKIPLVSLSIAQGNQLEGMAKEGKKIEVAFEGKAVSLPNPNAGKMSDFTSWGTTPSLDFKPEITAPGGKIYSTLNDDKYGVMSGTSMAAPHVAGGAALVMERVDKDFNQKGANRVTLAKNILMNTSRPQMDQGLFNKSGKTGNFYSPRREGAGLMDLHAAMKTPVIVTETKSGEGKAALKEVGDKFSFTLQLKNYSKKDAEYKVAGNVQTDLAIEGMNLLEADGIFKKGTRDSDDPNKAQFPISFMDGSKKVDSVKVKANSTAKVTVSVDLKDTVDWINNEPLKKIFKNGNFVEGFVRFVDVKGKNPNLAVPYVGFHGKWDQAPIIDAPLYDQDQSFYKATGLATEKGSTFTHLGEDVKGDVNKDKVSFSPNGDGSYDKMFPVLSFLRNAKNVEYSILDRNKKKVRTIETQQDVIKNYYDGGKEPGYNTVTDAAWDGTVNGKTVKDGLYYYEVKAVVDYKGAKEQKLLLPFYVDTKSPEVSAKWDNTSKTVSWNAKDNGTGVAYTDILVDGKSVLSKKLAPSEKEYKLEDVSSNAKIEVVSYDYAGNTARYMANGNKDKNVPAVDVETPKALTTTTSKTVEVKGSVTDESGLKSFSIDGKPAKISYDEKTKKYMFSQTLTFSKDDVHAFKVEAVDTYGNRVAFRRQVIVDSTQPTMKVTAPTTTTAKTATLKVALWDNYDEMKFYVNDDAKYRHTFKEPYEMRTLKHTYSEKVSLKKGKNTFNLKLVDLGGNIVRKTVTITKK
ncbi:lactocepin [Fictibacillus macauensis ZFHKF-1]|uniref:Lactocepin n=1 Tax=Fictibacillus macauensis ZFHKF-1 TaxID=1196324 RepID=I8IWL3_9BACL|nr:S8 family serine peptidase [Fictibacillus macauensis]EIT83891.1 lactocepin [Fictibacillus macauensis ZFHKF-1]